MIKLRINEETLLAMMKAFREYEKLIEPVAIDQPEFSNLLLFAKQIESDLFVLNRVIHRKYDYMSPEVYKEVIEKQIG